MVTNTYTGPSGTKYELREQTGADDEILSRMQTEGKQLYYLHQFLTGIIQSIDGMKMVTPEHIKQMRIRDKYAILILSRIFSLGENLIFEYTWSQDRPASEYSEDLTKLIWDYSKEFPNELSEDYYGQRITPYSTSDTFFEAQGRNTIYRLDYLTGEGEEILLKSKGVNVNDELVARKLSVQVADTWDTVKNFAEIPARDMAVIRNKVLTEDPVPSAFVQITNEETGESDSVPLLSIRDFFFPTLL